MRDCEEELSWRMKDAVRLYGSPREAYPFDKSICVELGSLVINRVWINRRDDPDEEQYIVYVIGGPIIFREVNGHATQGAQQSVIERVTDQLRSLMILEDLANI